MQFAPILSITFIVFLICVTCIIISIIRYKKKEKTPETRRKAKRKALIALAIFLLIAVICFVRHRVSHREWYEVTGNIMAKFPEISKISYEKTTPTLFIGLKVDEATNIYKMEEMFLCFLDEFDKVLLDELIHNTGSYEPADIIICFGYDTDKYYNELDFSTANTSSYTEWECTHSRDNQSYYGKKYICKALEE